MKLSLGFSPCPNDTFIFDALIHGKIDTEGLEFEVFYEDVESLNRKAFRAELDITKLSYFAFGQVLPQYVLLNSGSALGFGVGPLLIAAEAGWGEAGEALRERIASLRVAIPGRNTTANFLFSLAFPEAQQKQEMLFSEIEDAVLEKRADLGLIIHENRFTYRQKGLHKVMDLGEYWEKETGCPIPLGGIMVKRSLKPALQEQIDRLIRRSIEFAFANPDSGMDFIRLHAQAMDEEVMRRHIELYVNNYSLDLGEEGRKAVGLMFSRAAALGLIGEVKEPVFAQHIRV